MVGEWKGDMDIEKELSSDEDDFDGLDMHVWNHTEAFPHRKEGICLACSAYMHLKGGFGKYQRITPSSQKKEPTKSHHTAEHFSEIQCMQGAACELVQLFR